MQVAEVFLDMIFRDNGVMSRLRRVSDVVDRTRERMGTLSTNMQMMGGNMMQFGSNMVDGVSKPILKAFQDGIMGASDLNEAFNVVDTTFKNSKGEIRSWAKSLLNDFGLTEIQAIRYGGSMGAMLKSSGLAEEAAGDMAKSLVELNGDFSSFYNLSHDESWEKIRAGISGETEPLKALGINMSVANLESHALTMGIKDAWTEMTQAEQVQLRYSYLMKVSSDAQGDFSRTQMEFANQVRIAQGRIQDFSMNLGKLLLPTVSKVIRFFVRVLEIVGELPPKMRIGVIVFGLLAAAIPPLIVAGGALIAMIGGLIGVISAVGAPILIVGGIIAYTVTIYAAWGAAILAVAAKTGILQSILGGLKDIVMAIIAMIQGDYAKAYDILVEKLGFSQEKVQELIRAFSGLKANINKVIIVAKDVSKLLELIVTGKTKDLINFLIAKFGYSRSEAIAFSKKVEELRSKMIRLGSKLKDIGIIIATKFINKLKSAAKFIYDNRKEIAKFIDKMVTLGIKAGSVAKKVYDGFMKMHGAISKVVTKIKSVKFPSAPSWLPGFARGVTNFGGGYAMVGEAGPEIVKLPRGSDVIPNNEISDYATRELRPIKTGLNGEQVTNITINMQNTIDRSVNADALLNEFMRKLKSKGVVIRHA